MKYEESIPAFPVTTTDNLGQIAPTFTSIMIANGIQRGVYPYKIFSENLEEEMKIEKVEIIKILAKKNIRVL